MVKRQEGALLTCKPDVRAFIVHLNDQESAENKFILPFKSGNGDQLLVKRDSVIEIKRKVRDYFATLRETLDDD